MIFHLNLLYAAQIILSAASRMAWQAQWKPLSPAMPLVFILS
jgi:hypothetical protein